METKERNVALAIVFTIITCGIYGIYWFVVLTDEVKEKSKDEQMVSGGVAFLLSLITCGIYSIYWAYKMGKAMQVAEKNSGVGDADNSVLYLVLQLLGLGIVVYALIQSDLNAINLKKAK